MCEDCARWNLGAMKRALKNCGHTYGDVAYELGIGKDTVYNQLAGNRQLSADLVLKVAEMTGRTPNDFVDGPGMDSIPALRGRAAVRTRDAAQIAGVSIDTVYRAIKAGALKAYRTPDGQYTIRAEDLRAWIESRA